MSLRRAGNPAAAKSLVAEAGSSLRPADWPTPVALYLHGDLAESALLALATQPDRATLARYYIGMQHWLNGDRAKARELFDVIVATGDRAFLQTKLASDHLQEMSAQAANPAGASKE